MSGDHVTVRDAIDQVRAHLSKKDLGDWSWLFGHLTGRFISSFFSHGTGKGLRHLLSSTASLVDWIQRDPAHKTKEKQ